MLIIAVGGGVAYVYFSGDEPKPSAAQQNSSQDSTYSMPKPSKPSPNAQIGASIQSLNTPAKAGTNSSVTVKTLAGADCTISVTYNNVPSKDSGLIARRANDFGIVTWSWTVDVSAPAGKWPVKVTCTYNNRSAVVIGDLQVVE